MSLTVEQVKAQVDRIALIAGDDEMAHGAEDGLWGAVLVAIADGHPDPASIAAAALATRQITFERWCA